RTMTAKRRDTASGETFIFGSAGIALAPIVTRRDNFHRCSSRMGGDSFSSVAAVYDRRRCLNCCTVGAHRAPLQLGNPEIFKLSHYPRMSQTRSDQFLPIYTGT